MPRLIESTEDFVLKGKIKFINPVKVTPGKEGRGDFSSMSFGIDVGKKVSGTFYTNPVTMQATGENIPMFENLNIGDEILVAFAIKGTLKVNPEIASTPKNPNKEQAYTNLNAYDVEVLFSATPTTQPPSPEQTTTNTATPPEAVDDLPF